MKKTYMTFSAPMPKSRRPSPKEAAALVKKAAAEFAPSRKLAKKMFPEIDVGEVVDE